MAAKKTPLGQGLSVLLGAESNPLTYSSPSIQELPTRLLKPGVYQPRQSFHDEGMDALIQSVREKGILQPLIVREVEGEGTHFYEIIAGERRWRAANVLNLEYVPVIIRSMGDEEALEIALIENIQREDLNSCEEAEGYQRLMDEFHYTQEKLAEVIGKSRSYIANMLRLNTLPDSMKALVRKGSLSAGHLRAVMTLPLEAQESLTGEAIREQWSVRDLEHKAQSLKKKKTPKLELEDETTYQTQRLAERVSASLCLPVSIKLKKNGGQVTIRFTSFEEMDHVLERLRKET